MLLGSNSNLVLWTHAGLCYGIYLFGIHNPSHTISYHIYIYIHEFMNHTIHIYLILFGMIQVISVISQSWTVPSWRPTCPTGRSPWHRCGAPNLRPCWPSALALRDLFFVVWMWSGKNMFLYGKPHLYKCCLKTKRKKHRKQHLIYVKWGKQT